MVASTSVVWYRGDMESEQGFVAWQDADDYPDLMTSAQVCRAAHLTYRRLDYWVRVGMVSPEISAAGSGSARLFHPDVVEEIIEMKQRAADCPYNH